MDKDEFRGKLLEFFKEPHLRAEALREFEGFYGGNITNVVTELYNKGSLVKSVPVKVEVKDKRVGKKKITSCFYVCCEVMKASSGGAVYVPQIERQTRFYYKDSWNAQGYSFQRQELTKGQVLEFLRERKAATPREIQDYFDVPRHKVTTKLQQLVRSGEILRRGKKNRFGREVRVPKIGFIYGVDYMEISKLLNLVLKSVKFAPTRARALKRINADSSQGVLTAEVLFRAAPFNFAPTQLALIVDYCERNPEYEVFQWGGNKWFYNKKLIGEVLTDEELERKRKQVIETAKSGWNVALLSGIALEVAVEKALLTWQKFDELYTNIYIPGYNPYGREIDFIGTTKFIGSKKIYPQIYVGETKLTNVTQRHIERFYNKLRHAGWVRLGQNTIRISNKIMLKITRDTEIPAWIISANVTPIYVGLHFTKNAIAECKKFGIIWVYADNLLDILQKKTRRRIYSGRIIKVVERWVKEQMTRRAFISRKDVKNRLEKLLSQKFGI